MRPGQLGRYAEKEAEIQGRMMHVLLYSSGPKDDLHLVRSIGLAELSKAKDLKFVKAPQDLCNGVYR